MYCARADRGLCTDPTFQPLSMPPIHSWGNAGAPCGARGGARAPIEPRFCIFLVTKVRALPELAIGDTVVFGPSLHGASRGGILLPTLVDKCPTKMCNWDTDGRWRGCSAENKRTLL